MIKFGKEKKDIIKYSILLVAIIAAYIMLRGYWSEIFNVYLFLAILCVPQISFEKRNPIVADVFYVIYGTFFGIYFNHLITTYGHSIIVDSQVDSVIVFIILQGFKAVALELLIIPFVYLLLRTCRVPQKIAGLLAPVPTLLLCVADYYVYLYRGSEVSFSDIYNLNTGLNVAGNYSFPLWTPFIFAVFPFAIYAFSCIQIKTNKTGKKNVKKILINAGIYLAVTVAFLLGIIGATKHYSNTILVSMWDDRPSMNHGYITSFCVSIDQIKLEKPKEYNKENYVGVTDVPDGASSDVNIIVIMNESYADMSIYDLDSYVEPAPYWNELAHENNVRSGMAYSSVYGALTANSEFEMLTGLTIAELPYALTPYTTYINNRIYSLPRYLEEIGYSTRALHPYLKNGWNRNNVYPYMGFDEYLAMDDFKYTDADIIRGDTGGESSASYMSDMCAYENLVRMLDENKGGDPDFYFFITIQNHGGYFKEFEKLEVGEFVNGTDNDDMLNVYLSSVNRSDDALKYLVNELSNRDEKYVLLIFGDHQPSIDFGTDIEGIYDVDGEKWMVPYIIWTNYDMPDEYEGSDISTSINYFSLDLLDICGIPYTPYFDEINSVREELPIVHFSGFYSKEKDSWYPDYNNCDEEDRNLITRYNMLRYYNLIDYNKMTGD